MEYFSKLRLIERALTFLCVLRLTECLGELVDAVIYWGPGKENHFAEPSSAVYLDEDYWNELNRRSLLLRKQPWILS